MLNKAISVKQQTGVVLLEALLAILVFSLGILALVGLQATAVKQSTDAKYRSEAALLANDIIGQMWVSDRTAATLQTNFATGGTQYAAWQARVASMLPGVAANPPSVTISIDNSVAASPTAIATIQIFWVAPSEPAGTTPHNYLTIAQITR